MSKTVRWLTLPLFSETYVGIDEDAQWYVDPQRPEPAENSRSAMLLLPFMQEGYGGSYETAMRILRSALQQSGFSADLAETFPLYVPVLHAFQLGGWWTEAAVDWLPHLELTESQAYLVFVACQNRAITQKVRHTALAHIHRWEEAHGLRFIRPQADRCRTDDFDP